MSGNLRQTAVPDTLIIKAGLSNSHTMFSALPLSKQTSSGLNTLRLSTQVSFSTRNLRRDLSQTATDGRGEAPKGLFLQSVGEDANH